MRVRAKGFRFSVGCRVLGFTDLRFRAEANESSFPLRFDPGIHENQGWVLRLAEMSYCFRKLDRVFIRRSHESFCWGPVGI